MVLLCSCLIFDAGVSVFEVYTALISLQLARMYFVKIAIVLGFQRRGKVEKMNDNNHLHPPYVSTSVVVLVMMKTARVLGEEAAIQAPAQHQQHMIQKSLWIIHDSREANDRSDNEGDVSTVVLL